MSSLMIEAELSVSHDLVVPNSGLYFHLMTVLPPGLLEQAWKLYADAFECLRTRAVQRHVLYREEFDAVMRDTRVVKYLGFDGPVLTCFGTRTSELEAVTLISPEYFEARYPEQYAAQSIYYVLFFAIRTDYQRSGAVLDLMAALVSEIPADGILVIDIASARKSVHLQKAVQRTVSQQAPGARTVLLDEQTYYAYEFSPTD
ncbi:MAG: hypothetical protein QOG52_362 [Frankiaceae bacterium]|nr:hypothetical protein [Frankiaceae bacterium]